MKKQNCRTGHKTGATLNMMRNMVFTNIHDIDDGITDWQKAGYSVVKNGTTTKK